MKIINSNEIRKIWISFFQNKNHKIIDPSSLIPINDESLLWINSGVATIKQYFDGTEIPPSKRLTNIQRAIRTGDIDNVGKTSRHHTMFEMLGNFSIGDYFKKESVAFAYELLTSDEYFGFKIENLYITVYEDDDETFENWLKLGISKNNIFKMGKKTNFWDMGKGPSGPSTEIFYDRGITFDHRAADELIKNDLENDRFIEIWNIVFSQFNNDGKGNYVELPQKNIDTGAGLERLASIIQNTPTNFETDLFKPIIEEIEKITNHSYEFNYIPGKQERKQESINSYFKAIADFTRAVSFAILDGAMPGPNGRGYVLRKLIRKAYSYASKLGINNSFMFKLVNSIVRVMEDFYPLLKEKEATIKDIIKYEEDQFIKTISQSSLLLKNMLEESKESKVLKPEDVFKLYETYGLPFDYIYDNLEENKYTVDKEKVNNLMEDFKNLNKKDNNKSNNNNFGMKEQEVLFRGVESTEFIGYDVYECDCIVIASEGNKVALNKTPFYATSGGQEYDVGYINELKVINVEKNGDGVFIHEIEGSIPINSKVKAKIDLKRRKGMEIHHSAVHLLFSAFEKVWKTQLPQVGSKVEENFSRFDFTYQQKIDLDDLKKGQDIVNQWIKDSSNSEILETSIIEAKKMGASYLEGTKYGNIVRVVKLNNEVIDLCGGTHVKNTSEIEEVFIYNFEKKGSGVYRIEAVAGFENVKAKLIEVNKNFKQRNFESINSKINELIIKFDLINKDKKLIEFEKEKFTNILYSDPNYKIEFNKLLVSFNEFVKKQNALFVDEYIKQIETKLNSNNKTIVVNITPLQIKIIQKDLLNLINKFTNKILIIKTIIEQKGTVGILCTPDHDDELIYNKISELAEIKEIRGSGRGQLHIYGGQKENIISFVEEAKSW